VGPIGHGCRGKFESIKDRFQDIALIDRYEGTSFVQSESKLTGAVDDPLGVCFTNAAPLHPGTQTEAVGEVHRFCCLQADGVLKQPCFLAILSTGQCFAPFPIDGRWIA
jgi:hypothetical protein